MWPHEMSSETDCPAVDEESYTSLHFPVWKFPQLCSNSLMLGLFSWTGKNGWGGKWKKRDFKLSLCWTQIPNVSHMKTKTRNVARDETHRDFKVTAKRRGNTGDKNTFGFDFITCAVLANWKTHEKNPSKFPSKCRVKSSAKGKEHRVFKTIKWIIIECLCIYNFI